MVIFKRYVRFCRAPSNMAAMAWHSLTCTLWEFYIFVNSFENAKPVLTLLWRNRLWMALFKIYVWFCVALSIRAIMANHSLILDPLGICNHGQTLPKQLWVRWAITGPLEPLVSLRLRKGSWYEMKFLLSSCLREIELVHSETNRYI